MRFCLLPLLLALGCGWWSRGDDLAAEVARCAAIADSTERLAAYDALVADLAAGKALAEKPPAPADNGMGKWAFRSETTDDGDAYHVLELSAEPAPGRDGDPPGLEVALFGGTYSIAIFVGSYLGSKEVTVATRLDQNQPVVGKWSVNRDGDTAMLLRDCRPDILAMMKAQTLLVRIMPESATAIDLAFDIRGLSQGVRTLTEAVKKGGQ